MKTITKILGTAMLFMAVAVQAQELPRPLQKPFLTISGNYAVVGSSTTNIPVADAPIIPFTKNGLGFFLQVAGTNAATTTNCTLVFEQLFVTSDGKTNVIDSSPNTVTVSSAQNGTTRYDYFTNILATTANLPNSLLRLKTIQNTNLATIFFTNAVATALQ